MIRHDEECPMPAVSVREAGSPVMVGTMVQVPWLTVPLYAALFIALGWFGGEQWRNASVAQKPLVPLSQPAPQQAASVPVSAPTKQKAQASVEEESPQEEDYLPALRYSAHIYASSEDKRTIVINGQSWQEGQSPLPNLVIDQIQQDLTVFSFKGNTFTLAALDDWPGGIIADSPQGQ
jgi:general secretion pathway protein B